LKILVITQYYYPEPFRITDICETLVQRGHSVTVVTGQPNYPEGDIYSGYVNKPSRTTINGVDVYRTKIHPRKRGSVHLFLNYMSFPLYARKTIKNLDPDYDVVLINQLSPIISAIPGVKYAKKNKKKTLLYCLDLWPESLVSGGVKENSVIYKFFNRVSRKIYSSVDSIYVTSKSFIDKFEKYGINAKYLPQYAEDIFSQKVERVKMDNKFHVTFAGNIGEMQSVDTILYAANELIEHEKIVFDIYGSGSKFGEVSRLKSTFGLRNVILHGRKDISEMPKIYSNSDALLVTLKKNHLLSMTLPGKVQAYLAAGKPIIGAINGETRRVIEEAKCGYICSAEDYKSLSSLILYALDDKQIKEKGSNSRRFYENNFMKKDFIEKLEEGLMEVKYV